MVKKVLAAILSIATIMATGTSLIYNNDMVASAEDNENSIAESVVLTRIIGGDTEKTEQLSFEDGEGGRVVTGGIPYDNNGIKVLYIPSKDDAGNKVVGVADGAFEGNEDIHQIIIAEGIETIGEYAFKGCKNVAIINTPTSLKYIGDSAFEDCISNWSIVFSSKLEYIGKRAFANNASASDIFIEDYESPLVIDDEAFEGCINVTDLTIPRGLNKIGDNVFADCDAIKNIRYVGDKSELSKIAVGTGNDVLKDAKLIYNILTPKFEPKTEFVTGYDDFNFSNYNAALYGWYTDSNTEDMLREKFSATDLKLIDSVRNLDQGGYCYGIATINLMEHWGYIGIDQFDNRAETVGDVRISKKLISKIAYYHLTQATAVQQTCSLNGALLEDPITVLEEKLSGDDKKPLLICIRGTINTGETSGHAVIGYDIEYGTFNYGGREWDARVLISDCNMPGTNANTDLYFDTKTHEYDTPGYTYSPEDPNHVYTWDNFRVDWVCDSPQVLNYKGLYEAGEEGTWDIQGTEIVKVFGDCNLDNVFDVKDIIYLQKYILGTTKISTDSFSASDINNDGEVDIFDLALLKQALLKK